MNPKLLRELRQFRKAAQANAWASYRSLIGRLCQAHIQFEHSRRILGLLRNSNVGALVEYADSLSEQSYSDAELHFSANQFAALIRKYPFPAHLSPFRAKEAAKEKWLKAEDRCLHTNNRFLGSLSDLEERLHPMRAFIMYVLGRAPRLSDVFSNSNFGPGASIGVHGNATNVARKIASRWTVSSCALNFAYGAFSSNHQLMEIILPKRDDGMICFDSGRAWKNFLSRIECVQYNKIAFVPKTVKIERPIAVEPLLNGFVQKGVDLVMRGRLRMIGLDLTDQSLNQRLAREGSVDDSAEGFVTIDLSSASDSIATEVVRNLLPEDWYYLLDSIRSKNYCDEKGVVSPYHKFCSMGNGFCFPLETLIFAAACSSVGCGRPGIDYVVYGDDIIVRKKFAEPVLSLLGELGFVANSGKTYLDGPFRESCGSDWFGGEDVRPFTLDFSLDSLESYFKFLNLSERNARTRSFFAPIRQSLIEDIPSNLRFCRSRDGNADSGYRVEEDVFMSSPHVKWDISLQCWSWLELVNRSVPDQWTGLQDARSSHVYAALSGASSDLPFTVRRKTKTNVRRVAYG